MTAARALLLAVLTALALGAGAGAAAPTEPDPALAALKLSADIARAGRERRDPWLLAAAARLRRQIPVQVVERPPQDAAGDAAGFDPAEVWLQQAELLGGREPRLQGFIGEVRSFAFRGRTGGPKVSTARLRAGDVHHYGEVFDPSRPAVIYVEGDGDSDLTLSVRDASGAEPCAEAGPGDVKICTWTPRAAGPVRIEVANHGGVEDRYALATN